MRRNKPKIIDLTGVLRKYKNTWVVLNRRYDKVISSANTPKEALEKAQKKGYSNPLVLWAAENFGGSISMHR